MPEPKGFALRISPELKTAARMLSNTEFFEPRSDGFGIRPVRLSSINDALIYLMEKGMKPTIEQLDREITRAKGQLEIWEPAVSFLLQNPTADGVEASNFAEGSPAWCYLNQLESDDQMGVLRAVAMRELADAQESCSSMLRAKEAIEKVLAAEKTQAA